MGAQSAVLLARGRRAPHLGRTLTRRLATALSVSLVLAGGVALAQPDLIVDPWQRALAAKAPAPADPVSPPPAEPQRADSGWFDDERPTPPAAKPVVEPRSSARAAQRHAVSAPAPVAKETPHPLHPSSWASVVPEIIDPWGPRPLVAYRDPLIVDPWAR